MRGLWKGFWQISKTERIGYLLLFALLSLHLSIGAWGPRPIAISQEVLASMPQSVPATDSVPTYQSREVTSLFEFDINTANPDELKRLGLKEKSIAGLLRFRSKGGKVRNEADFNKLFSLSAAEKERLRPWLRFPEEAMQLGTRGRDSAALDRPAISKVFVRIDLNQADSIQLLTVPGIGPAFASRIIRYRERLGGYVRLEQLLEVFGIDSAKYEALWPLLEVKSSTLRRVQPCEASEEELAAHPYVGKVLARRWAAYRLQRGCKGCTDMQKLAGLEAERWEKLLPYLDCAGLQ
ncbi:MAG: hypothetical protein C0424_03980 [Sphingobacteriaceae bacterium]|nr:hypothetical protein [Sphingobacteriaceae bacterium]